jgi:autotransporter-associated beta strand protein
VPFIITGANNLNLSGLFDLSGTNRVVEVDNTDDTTFSGDITDDGEVFGFTKTGAGSLYLDGTNDFTGTLTNSDGLLAGSGIVTGPVVVLSGATLGAGDDGVIPGTFILNGGLTLNGNVSVRVNKSQVLSNDLISVTGTLVNAGTGTVTVANVGTALKVGDSFTLFSEPITGSALTVSGGGVTWNNHLATDGGITVATIVPTTPPVFFGTVVSGTNIVSGVSNGSPGSTYYVLATTNVALPPTSWTPIATNTYPSGVFYLTNAITPGVAHRFYLLSPTP